MKREGLKLNRHQNRPSNILNIMSLKFMEGNVNINQSNRRIDDKFHKITNQIINTPSTVGNTKKFHSCEIYKNYNASIDKKHNEFVPENRLKGYDSATKILTLNQIKVQSRLIKQSKEINRQVRKQSSKKLFVTLSSRNSLSKEKGKIDPQFNKVQCILASQQIKQTRPKHKLNVYRGIARARNQ